MRHHGWHHGRGYDPMAKGIEGWRVEAISGGMAGAIEAMAECIIPGIKGGIMAGGIMAPWHIMVALWEGRNLLCGRVEINLINACDNEMEMEEDLA